MLKTAILAAALLSLSGSAFARPGSRSVSCKSLPGAKKRVSLSVSITGTPTPDMPAEADLAIDAADFKNDNPERTALSINFHPRDKVFTAAFNERDEKHVISIELWAKPATIRGGLNKQTCFAKYTFRAGFTGEVYLSSGNPVVEKNEYVDDDIVECEYSETYGSAGC